MESSQTLHYDVTTQNKENMTIDYRNSNYKTVLIPLPELTDKQIAIKQDFKLGKGGIFWDNSFYITKYMIDNIFTDKSIKNVIELGAGTALPSIAALIKGYNVVTTDIPKLIPFVDDIITMNKEIYSKSSQSKVIKLSWENKEDIEEVKKLNNNEPYDLIIGSELIYLDDLFDDLINTLRELSSEKTVIIMSYKVRLQEMVDDFINRVSKYFKIEYIDNVLMNETYPRPDKMKLIRLYKIK